jgi:hypothetical protein
LTISILKGQDTRKVRNAGAPKAGSGFGWAVGTDIGNGDGYFQYPG